MGKEKGLEKTMNIYSSLFTTVVVKKATITSKQNGEKKKQ